MTTALTTKEIRDLNRMNAAATHVGLGTRIDDVENGDLHSLSIITGPTSYLVPAASVGIYGTGLADTYNSDNINFSSVLTTGSNKGEAAASSMAAFIGVSNTANVTNNRMQGLLASNSVGGNVFDAYAVQGHVTIATTGSNTVSTQVANAHITGLSGKALLSGSVAQGWVTGVLGIIDGLGTVTGLCHVIAAQVEATTTANQVDAIVYLGADQTVPTALQFAGTANMTNFAKFNAIAGFITSASITNSDASPVYNDALLKCDINGTPYYIPLYNTI